MSLAVHIVCFDVPYPVSHGGFYDLFYKIRAISGQGVAITLHCFEYGRGEQPALNQWCKEVHYYKRKKGLAALRPALPYIVSSRVNRQLVERLSADSAPILLEGTHSTYLLFQNYFPDRTILYRLHNLEHLYYRQLARWEGSLPKKIYYRLESLLLAAYEKKIAPRASTVLTVSEKDRDRLQKDAPTATVAYLPVFLPFTTVKSLPGSGAYAIYHGNLAVAENEAAVRYVLEALDGSGMFLVIAGKNPSKRLVKFISRFSHVRLVADPEPAEMEALIRDAHIHLVISFNETGVKLKLLYALFCGRHCLINRAAGVNAEIDALCSLANDAEALRQQVLQWKEMAFTEEAMQKRQAVLAKEFNTEETARKLIAYLR